MEGYNGFNPGGRRFKSCREMGYFIGSKVCRLGSVNPK